MTRAEYIARAYLAADLDSMEEALAWAPRPATLSCPVLLRDESDVAGGRLVLGYQDPIGKPGAVIRAYIVATFTGPICARVTGHNRHGARQWLADRLTAIMGDHIAPHGLPPVDLPPELT